MNKIVTLLCLLAIAFSCKTPEPREAVSSSSGSFIQESVTRNKALIAKEEETIKALIAQDTINNFTASANGFWYAKTVQDTITNKKFPAFGDQVTFNYQIEDINGNVIYPMADLSPRSYLVDQQELISGLREGLKLMTVGESIILYLPSYKAYGYYGDENRIGTNVPLKLLVNLTSISVKE